MKWGDFLKYLEIAPFSSVIPEKKYKKTQEFPIWIVQISRV